MNYNTLKQLIKTKAPDFGFLEAKVANLIIPEQTQQKFKAWLARGYAGDMEYLNNNSQLRLEPQQLVTDSLSIICVKAPYLQQPISFHKQRLTDANHAYISSYALGRDYHKVVKRQLTNYATWINQQLASQQLEHQFRVFTDSAPILEVEIASNAGNGWRGKNTLLLHREQGSMFFLGEIFTTLPLEPDQPTSSHCGSCSKCMQVCPTQAFIEPYVLDARKCIAYLTIENQGPIPLEYRQAIGNRVYGCDDCQLFCPWNKFSQLSNLPDFAVRNRLDSSSILELFSWDEKQFKHNLAGSPIYRIGYQRWLRNLAVGLGNAAYNPDIVAALTAKLTHATAMVQEHIHWAISQQLAKQAEIKI